MVSVEKGLISSGIMPKFFQCMENGQHILLSNSIIQLSFGQILVDEINGIRDFVDGWSSSQEVFPLSDIVELPDGFDYGPSKNLVGLIISFLLIGDA